MNRTKMLGVVMMLGIGMVLVGVSAAADDEKKPKASGDQEFARKVSASGLAEVNLSELAVRFASNPAVKQFAQRMIADHKRAGQEIIRLANARSIRVASEMDEKHQKLFDKLKELKGEDFDRTYMEAMVKDHEEAVKLFESEAKDGKDEAMKRWAGDLEPIFKKHLEKAREICKEVKGEDKKGNKDRDR